MANFSTEGYGFLPYGADLNENDFIYAYVPSSDSTALGIGSPVKKVGTSNTAVLTLGSNRVAGAHGFDIGQLPVVAHALDGATDKVWGVVVAVLPNHNDFTAVNYRPASVEAVVRIARVHRGRLFRVMSDAAVPAASVGLNVNMSASPTVSTVFGKSKAVVDGGNAAADVTFQFKIVSIGRNPSQSDITAAGVELIVEGNVGYDVYPDVGI